MLKHAKPTITKTKSQKTSRTCSNFHYSNIYIFSLRPLAITLSTFILLHIVTYSMQHTDSLTVVIILFPKILSSRYVYWSVKILCDKKKKKQLLIFSFRLKYQQIKYLDILLFFNFLEIFQKYIDLYNCIINFTIRYNT